MGAVNTVETGRTTQRLCLRFENWTVSVGSTDLEDLAWLAAFTLNELQGDTRGDLRERMVAAAAAGHAILIIEPLAGAVAPWWHDWADAFHRVGGRTDEWRVPGRLPDLVARFDRAAGLRHDELTARTIYVAQRENRGGAREARG